ncbi:MAG: DUF4390 domain-containing protein [Rhodocyclaceae bacterium]
MTTVPALSCLTWSRPAGSLPKLALARSVRLLALALLFLLLGAMGGRCAVAAEVEAKSASLSVGDDGYNLNADFKIELSPRLEDIIAHGVPLFFIAEFEITRPRWYWFDEEAAAKSRTIRVSYHALTRQYRVSFGALHQSFPSLADALRTLERVREWPVAEKGSLMPGRTYQARVRLRLDLSLLPKPLQVTSLGSRDWNLGSEWFRFDYAPESR